ncbi:uncharacterized protein SRS1_15333 [Sporisorium reilianum f. sp. reilianum]|uniref:Uncharacterized protein n=1 Tax=Sporisorium reilianum f. sp. reilianum TaxID=72559 RepID=A0A2N8UIX7_9BASI|nr:uncharacterized protein SRS1_15333 [Sporisorium reilianum f. sp. reilianum]
MHAVRAGRAEGGYGMWARVTSLSRSGAEPSSSRQRLGAEGDSATDSSPVQSTPVGMHQDVDKQREITSQQDASRKSEEPTSSRFEVATSSHLELDMTRLKPTSAQFIEGLGDEERSEPVFPSELPPSPGAGCDAVLRNSAEPSMEVGEVSQLSDVSRSPSLYGSACEEALEYLEPLGALSESVARSVKAEDEPTVPSTGDRILEHPSLPSAAPDQPPPLSNPCIPAAQRAPSELSELDELRSDGDDDRSAHRPIERQLPSASPLEQNELKEEDEQSMPEPRCLRSSSRAAAAAVAQANPATPAQRRQTRASSAGAATASISVKTRAQAAFASKAASPPVRAEGESVTKATPVKAEREKRTAFLKGCQRVTSICTRGMRPRAKVEHAAPEVKARGRPKGKAGAKQDGNKKGGGAAVKTPVAKQDSQSQPAPSASVAARAEGSSAEANRDAGKPPARKRSKRRMKKDRRKAKLQTAKARAATALLRQEEAERRQRDDAAGQQQADEAEAQDEEPEEPASAVQPSQDEVAEEPVTTTQPLPDKEEQSQGQEEDEFDFLDDTLIQAVDEGSCDVSAEAVEQTLQCGEASAMEMSEDLAPAPLATLQTSTTPQAPARLPTPPAPKPSTPSQRPCPSAPPTPSQPPAASTPSRPSNPQPSPSSPQLPTPATPSTPPLPPTSAAPSASPVATTPTAPPVASGLICDNPSQRQQLAPQSPRPPAHSQPVTALAHAGGAPPSTAARSSASPSSSRRQEPQPSSEEVGHVPELNSRAKQLYLFLPSTADLLSNGKLRRLSEPIEVSSGEEKEDHVSVDDEDDEDHISIVDAEPQRKKGPGRPRKHGRSGDTVDEDADEAYAELNVATAGLEGENNSSEYVPSSEDSDAVTESSGGVGGRKRTRRRRSLPAMGERARGSPAKRMSHSQGGGSTTVTTAPRGSTPTASCKRRKQSHPGGRDSTWNGRLDHMDSRTETHRSATTTSHRQGDDVRSDDHSDSTLSLLGANSVSELYGEGLVDVRSGFETNRELLERLNGLSRFAPAVSVDDAMQRDASDDDAELHDPTQSGFTANELNSIYTPPSPSSLHDPSPPSPASSAPLRLSQPSAYTPTTPSFSTLDPEATNHLQQRILDDARIMQSAAERALAEFVRAQKAYDRMSLDLALLGHDAGGQSGTINEYAQRLSAFSRFADLHAAGVERTLVYGADSVPQVQLEEASGWARR